MSDRIYRIMRGDSFREPLVLLFVTVLAYGLLIPWLGYYYDDWIDVLVYSYGGARGFLDAFMEDRPLLGYYRAFLTPLFGQSPLPWHIYALATRFLWTLAFWWLVRSIWPEHRRETFLMSLLFATFPGFAQQPIARTYGLANVESAAELLSFALMVRSVTVRRYVKVSYAASIFLMMVCLIHSEYHVGFELFRPILLYLVIRKGADGRASAARRAIIAWAPFALFIAGYVVFRTFFWTSKLGSGSSVIFSLLWDLRYRPFHEISWRFAILYSYIANAFLFPYGKLIDGGRYGAWSVAVAGYWAVAAVVAAALFAYFRRCSTGDDAAANPLSRSWYREAILLGLTAWFLSIVHIWVVGYPIRPDTVKDRFARLAMFGFAVAAIPFLALLVSNRRRLYGTIAVVVGLSAGFHVFTAERYRRDWELQRDLMAQLRWRAPGISRGTAVAIDGMDRFAHYNTSQSNMSVNLLYADKTDGSRILPYRGIDISGAGRDRLDPDSTYESVIRGFVFQGSMSQAIVVAFDPPWCLRLVDPSRTGEYPLLSAQARAFAEYSRLDLVEPIGQPPSEPVRSMIAGAGADCWCRYIEQAELARQFGDWSRVAALGDSMQSGNVRSAEPRTEIELAVFVEGYARVGRYAEAEVMARRVDAQPFGKLSVRSVLARLEREPEADSTRSAFVERLREDLGIRIAKVVVRTSE